MKKIIHYLVVISAFSPISCNYQNSTSCSKGFVELKVPIANSTFQLPPYILKDTGIYGGSNKLLSYKIVSLDSSFSMNIFVDNYADTSRTPLALKQVSKVQKGEVESALNSKKFILEQYKTIGKNNIGFLKYFVEQGSEKFYAGRIFYYVDKKLTVCWLFEKVTEESNKKQLAMDCVFESLVID